ncbi:hypothetical protein BB561_000198 [Smittium simulii]|uniref:Kinetochore protein Mis12/MTW1 n=1 Tax=Smittium simulii TaxID=133385 RepID=A0A2T9Z007_9FUNG|nr:hypothetical protein BB561_000198 [Smittium simulii]
MQNQDIQKDVFEQTAALTKDLGDKASLGKFFKNPAKQKRFSIQYPPSQLTYEIIFETFGFIPLQFIDDIINAANDSIYRVTKKLTEYVEAEQGAGLETDQAINRVETLLEYAVDKYFDKFELYALRNIFNIPKGLEYYIKMPNRKSSCVIHSKKDQEDLVSQIDKNFKNLLDLQIIEKKLDSNLELLDKQLSEIESLESSLREIFGGQDILNECEKSSILPHELLTKMSTLEPELKKITDIAVNVQKNITFARNIQILTKPNPNSNKIPITSKAICEMHKVSVDMKIQKMA